MMEIKTDDYRLWYENETSTLNCQGSLRLNGMDEYDPIIQLLESAIEQEPETMILNLKGLEFLNSSGIDVALQVCNQSTAEKECESDCQRF